MTTIEFRVLVTTDDERAEAVDRLEGIVRRAVGREIDPQRVYVEAVERV